MVLEELDEQVVGFVALFEEALELRPLFVGKLRVGGEVVHEQLAPTAFRMPVFVAELVQREDRPLGDLDDGNDDADDHECCEQPVEHPAEHWMRRCQMVAHVEHRAEYREREKRRDARRDRDRRRVRAPWRNRHGGGVLCFVVELDLFAIVMLAEERYFVDALLDFFGHGHSFRRCSKLRELRYNMVHRPALGEGRPKQIG